MRKLMLTLTFFAAISPAAFAQRKDCNELKMEIEAKLAAKGVQGYTLEIVENDAHPEGQVVGTCDGGTKKIVYRKGS